MYAMEEAPMLWIALLMIVNLLLATGMLALCRVARSEWD